MSGAYLLAIRETARALELASKAYYQACRAYAEYMAGKPK